MSLKIPNNVLFNTNFYSSLLQSPTAKSCSFRHLEELSAICPHLSPNRLCRNLILTKTTYPIHLYKPRNHAIFARTCTRTSGLFRCGCEPHETRESAHSQRRIAPRRSCEFTARALLCLACSHTWGPDALSLVPIRPYLSLERVGDVHVNLCVGSRPTKGPHARPRPIHRGPEMMHRLVCLDRVSRSLFFLAILFPHPPLSSSL